MEKCSICHKPKPIVKRERQQISGTANRFRGFLVCAECDSERAAQYKVSQARHAREQISTIDKIIQANPEMAPSLEETRQHWLRELEQS